MKVYDVMLYCSGDYCSGAFYDTYEYFRMFKKCGYNVCFVSCMSPEADTSRTLTDRYINPFGKDMYYFNFNDMKNKLLPVGAKILFTTSIYAAADIITKPIMIYHDKMILIHETVFDDPQIQEAFGKESKRLLGKVLMLGDMRIFGELGNYEHKDYKRKIYFDIWKPLKGEVEDRIMINMATKHKCYDVGYLNDYIHFYKDRYLIYTRPKFYDKYKSLISDTIDVKVIPIENFMNKWNKALYLNSKRGQDPSPRVIAECKWYNKKLIYFKLGGLRDGAYYRYIDVSNGLDNLKLTENDEIFKIVDRYL